MASKNDPLLTRSGNRFIPQTWRPTFSELETLTQDLHLIVSRNLHHSKTFSIYNALFERHGFDAVYLPYELPDRNGAPDFDAASDLFNWGRESGKLRSLLVSDPFKAHIFSLCQPHELATRAVQTNAVNMISFSGSAIIATNLDGAAALAGLRSEVEISGIRSAAFLGSGGVSTAVAFELAPQLQSVLLVDRDEARTRTLEERLAKYFPTLTVLTQRRPKPIDFSGYDFIYNGTGLGKASANPMTVNATPLEPEDTFGEGGIAVDANYTPPETRFLTRMKSHNYTLANGQSHMLGSTRCHLSFVYGFQPEWQELFALAHSLS